MIWVCASCTYENLAHAIRCDCCTAWKDDATRQRVEKEATPASVDSSHQWACPACTFVNELVYPRCYTCKTRNTPAAAAPSIPPPHPAAAVKANQNATYTINEQAWTKDECLKMCDDFEFACRHATKASESNHDGDDNEPSVVRARLHDILARLYQGMDVKPTGVPDTKQKESYGECQSCYDELTDENRIRLSACGHESHCRACVAGHCKAKISGDQVMPWLRCPHFRCNLPMTAADLRSCDLLLDTAEWALCVATLLRCRLARNEHFRVCPTSKCLYGFLILQDARAEQHTCPVCRAKHSIKLSDLAPEFKQMIADGTMRPCPTCKQLTTKEVGICNAINCVKCGAWWNWSDRSTAKDEASLKAQARANGTLWEKGELQYQQALQKKDPQAFKQLLERNGIKFDPNYQRGT